MAEGMILSCTERLSKGAGGLRFGILTGSRGVKNETASMLN